MTMLPIATRFWRWLEKGPLDRWPSAWTTKTMNWWPWKSSGTRRGVVDGIGSRGGTAWFWPLLKANPSLLCLILWFFFFFLYLSDSMVGWRQEYGLFGAFCLVGVKGRDWENELLLQHRMTPCLPSSFLTIPVIPQSFQISPPGLGGAEDLGSSQKEGQRQYLQCGAHEGLFLLPQSPLHHLWTPGVSCSFFWIYFLLKSSLKWQKRNPEVRTLDCSGCEHLMNRMDAAATQSSRKLRSKGASTKPAYLTPSLSYACHLPVYIEFATKVLGAGLGDITKTKPLSSRKKLKYFEKDFSSLACPPLTGFATLCAEAGTLGSRQLTA